MYLYFNRYDSTLNDILDPQYASVESKMDSRIQSKYLGNEAVCDNHSFQIHRVRR